MRYIYQGTVKDGNGRVIGSETTSDGNAPTISVYLAGGSTAASIYAASSGGNAVNSVSADEYGQFEFYVDPKDYPTIQEFKITITHSDFESQTYDELKIFPDLEYRYVVDSTETDQGAAGDGFSLKDLVDSIGTSQYATIYLPHSTSGNTTTYTLTTSETIPKNINLMIHNGARIDGAGTLTFTRPDQIIAQNHQQIFGSSITISFSNGGTVYPNWWQENTTPGTTDMATAINSAIDSVGTSYGKVIKLLTGKYAIGSTIELDDNGIRFEGAGRGPGGRGGDAPYREAPTLLIWTGSNSESMIEAGSSGGDDCWGIEIRNMEIDADETTGSTGVYVYANATNVKLIDLAISRTQSCGIYFVQAAWKPYLENVGVYDYEAGGMDFRGQNHNAILLGCQFHFCDDTTPDYAVRFGEDAVSAGVNIIGCNFEPWNAPTFLYLKDMDAAIVSGCYFEAKAATVTQFIKIGDTTDVAASVAVNIIGNTFQGKTYTTNAITIEGPSDGVVVEGNHAYGLTSFINSQVDNRECSERNNIVTTTTNLISTANGVSDGWRSETYLELDADDSTSPTLTMTHYTNNPYKRRLITAHIIFELVEAAGADVKGTFRIQKDGGGGYENLSEPVIAQVAPTGATAVTHKGTVVITAADLANLDDVDYQVTFTCDAGDSLTIKAGSFIHVREVDSHHVL